MATGDAGLPGNVIVDVLNQCREMIVTNLSSFNCVMDHIVTKGVFTDVEVHDIMDLTRTSDKVIELILLVKRKGSKTYGAFLSALSSTKQEHLLGKIEKEESKFLKDMEHAPVEESKKIYQYDKNTLSMPGSSSSIKALQPRRECSEPSTRDGDVSFAGHAGTCYMTKMDKN